MSIQFMYTCVNTEMTVWLSVGKGRQRFARTCAIAYKTNWHVEKVFTFQTVLSRDAIRRLTLPTWSFWYREDGRDRLKPPLA